jgi:hypothetical protein
MPRQSAADLEMSLFLLEKTGAEVEVIPPESLLTSAQRDAYRALLFKYPHVTKKRSFEGALANYVLLRTKIRRLPEASIEAIELLRGIANLEEYLGLPRS